MNSSKIHYGDTIITIQELIESNKKGFIKLEYYGTKEIIQNGYAKYGIEVVKKEYINKDFFQENKHVSNITNDEKQIEEIISILKRNKVTPVGLKDIVSDLVKERMAD